MLIPGPQGTEKPPKGVKCWWTAADYEEAFARKYELSYISYLKALIKKKGVDKKSVYRVQIQAHRPYKYREIVNCNYFDDDINIRSWSVEIRTRTTEKSNWPYLRFFRKSGKASVERMPILCSVYKDEEWWFNKIKERVINVKKGTKRSKRKHFNFEKVGRRDVFLKTLDIMSVRWRKQ